MIVAGLEAQRPLPLPRGAQHQAGSRVDHAHRGRTVGDHVEPMQAGVGQRRFADHAIQHRGARHVLRLPLAVVLAQW
ncbi:hypothetical protein D3C73_1439130 [compost metagenome]